MKAVIFLKAVVFTVTGIEVALRKTMFQKMTNESPTPSLRLAATAVKCSVVLTLALVDAWLLAGGRTFLR